VVLSWLPSVAASLPRYTDHVVQLQYWHCAGRSLTALFALITFGLTAPQTRSACCRCLTGAGASCPSITTTSSSAVTDNRNQTSSNTIASSFSISASGIAPVGRQQAARASESRRRAAGMAPLTVIDDLQNQTAAIPLIGLNHGECIGSNRRKPNVTRMYVTSIGEEKDGEGFDVQSPEITAVMSSAAIVPIRASSSSFVPAASHPPGKSLDATPSNGPFVAVAGYATLQPRRVEAHCRNAFAPSPFARRVNLFDSTSSSSAAARGNDICRSMVEFDDFRYSSSSTDVIAPATGILRHMEPRRGDETQRYRPPAVQRPVEAYGGEDVVDSSLVHTSV